MEEIKSNRVVGSGAIVGSKDFFNWLATKVIFRYWVGDEFIDIRRKKAGVASPTYWYAYKHKDGITRNQYIGKSGDLSPSLLFEVFQTCMLPTPEYLKARDVRRYARRISEISSEAHLLTNKLNRLVDLLQDMKLTDKLTSLEHENNALREMVSEMYQKSNPHYSNII